MTADLPPAVRVLADAIRARGLEPELVRFAEPVPTAAVAAEKLGCEVRAIANSLIFDADGAALLVLASGAHRVDTTLVARTLGVQRVRRADPDFVLRHTGQQVGGVGPVGHPTPVRTVIDADLAASDRLFAGGGDEHTMLATTFDDLVAMTGGTVLHVA